MNTLVELYDERSIENVIGVETFKPSHAVYLCPPEVAQDRNKLRILKEFFRHRGLQTNVEFVESSLYKADKILKQLERIADMYPDMALDVTGGTDAALFASGMLCNKRGIPAFTYSRRKNKFYEISHASFADGIECELKYNVEDLFLMTGGTLRKGRIDNSVLSKYMDFFEPFFSLFMKHKRHWVEFITFMQRISQTDSGNLSLHVKGDYFQKGEHKGQIAAQNEVLSDFERIGFIKNLEIKEKEYVSFDFYDQQVRFWLRDVGSVLELYMYKACLDAGIFQDVISSTVVDWDEAKGHDLVSNEIDVVAVRGIVPVFISCKACDIKTISLNELEVLRERFGGKGAKAVIVTSERCHAAARHRAAQLGITVIDAEELESENIPERLKVIMKVSDGTAM